MNPTPGPWRIILEDGHWIVRGANYDAVCRLYAGGNGDLIAAAPALLEALRDIDWDETGTPTGWPNQDRVLALIAKAEGR
jgi:hypothetical protein